MADLNQSYDDAKSQINAIKSYKDISAAAKKLQSSVGNSFSESSAKINTSLDKISEQQKRYLRDQPTSFDQLLELITITNGSGLESTKYLKKKLLEVVVKIEPQIQKIISEEALKALGCSQEQTFQGYSLSSLQLNPLKKEFAAIIDFETCDLIERINPGEGIARNYALRENLFIMFISIVNKLPLFLTGNPGNKFFN